MGAGGKRGHPLLRGGGARREGYTHGFSASQMAALTALCGALVPSLRPAGGRNPQEEEEEDGGRGGGGGGDKVVEGFLLASAADPPVPDEVAELMSRRCLPEALALVRAVLWLLGTRLGSLALCGPSRCLSWRFPFARRFAELPLEHREAAARRWSRQTLLPPLRMFFLITKVFCLYVFYSWTDENSENPHWRAIGYSPPLADEEPAAAEEDAERPEKRPLDDGVVETINETDASLPASLVGKGLAVTEDAARNVCRACAARCAFWRRRARWRSARTAATGSGSCAGAPRRPRWRSSWTAWAWCAGPSRRPRPGACGARRTIWAAAGWAPRPRTAPWTRAARAGRPGACTCATAASCRAPWASTPWSPSSPSPTASPRASPSRSAATRHLRRATDNHARASTFTA
ncbi:hypothetical protein PVAP13_1NG353900 [Panicum virgatum]|uniref:Uncharacterized protein n=1 Tax=Panicum virgatum TaxID=38727 RepID=A0A8T0WYT8_PANVG|nr:hypothetical protein PVAP13_1NG353900 [Panicum virgatum]